MAKGKGRRGSKRIAKKTQKMMTGSCMFGGNSAPYSSNASGNEAYARAIFGDRGEQVADGMGGNHIKMNDPAVAWKGGQRGGGEVTIAIPDGIPAGATNVKITWTDPVQATEIQQGGNMFGAAIVPAALLAANQLYKPTRAINNLSFSRKKGFRKTMKKMMAKRRR